MSKTIVCGVDRSEESDRAAGVAARLAEAMACDSVLVHVQEASRLFERMARPSGGGWGARRRLRAAVSRHRFPHRTRALLRAGDPADEIMRLADEHDAGLVVVGSHGRRELGRAVLGDVSSALMRSSPCPVVVVPPDAVVPRDPGQLGSVVCGIEGTPRDADVLGLAADLVGHLGGTLHAVHAFDVRATTAATAPYPPPIHELREAAEDTLAHALVEARVRAHGQVVSLAPAGALARAAEDKQAGLVVVGSHGGGRLGSVLLGSVKIQLISEARTPVVVLPPDAELAAGSGHYEVATSPA